MNQAATRGADYLDAYSDELVIKELALLSPMQYDRVRNQKADELGVQISTLDREVKLARKDIQIDSLKIAAPDPWKHPVDGAELLDEIVLTLNRYLVLPSYAPEAIALWILFTYIYDFVRICPLLVLTSPEKRCGKTSTLTMLLQLTNRALPASNISPAALFRTTEKIKPTLLIDEADTFLKNSEELRGIINSGHTREMAFTTRLVGDDHEPKQFSTWGPKAIAAIGSLKDTLVDRSIIVPMRRKKVGEKVERLRGFNGDEIKARCLRWAKDNEAKIRECIDPDVPSSLHDRAADNWEPLLMIADIAGGDWPLISRKAAVELNPVDTDTDSIRVQLLSDIQEIFGDNDKIHSENLLEKLHALKERPWGDWKLGKSLNNRQLAGLLKSFEIKSKDVRIFESVKKGYRREDFEDAFSRYLSATGLQTSSDTVFSDFSNATQNFDVADGNSLETTSEGRCSVVADKLPESEGNERRIEI